MLAGDFAPSFGLDGAAKDAGLIVDAARAAGADVGVIEASSSTSLGLSRPATATRTWRPPTWRTERRVGANARLNPAESARTQA